MILGSRTYDQSVDIWSLGCIYAELLQGVPLFKGNNEIDQISRIFKLLGSPSEENWKKFNELPDSQKIVFMKQEGEELEKVFLQANHEEIEFLKLLLKFQNRPRARELLSHKYFQPPRSMKDLSISVPEDLNQTKEWENIDFYKFFLGDEKKKK